LANWTPLNGQEKMLQAITIGVERRGATATLAGSSNSQARLVRLI
jgi:hypothetical protein